MAYANNKDENQPAHPHSLFSDFHFRCIARNILLRLLLASVAELAGLSLTWSYISKGRFYEEAAQLVW